MGSTASWMGAASSGASGWCGEAENVGDDDNRDGRSSDLSENGVAAHGRNNGWVLWTPDGVLSTVTCSVAAIGDGGHGGDMAGRAKLPAMMANGVRGQLE